MKNPRFSNAVGLARFALGGLIVSGTALTGITVAVAGYGIKKSLARRRSGPSKVVVITGGSTGLGFALARRFARAGDRLVLAARSPEDLSAARDRLLKEGLVASADDILLVPADLTDPAQAGDLILRAISHFGRIDVLINNAGIIDVGPFESHPLETFRLAMQTNFFAALHTTQAALPHMLDQPALPPAPTQPAARGRAAGRSVHRANIVNISSIGGKFAMPHLLPYVASKFALTGFSEGLHAELRHKGIRVTTVCPGLMRTGGEDHAHFSGQVKKEQRWFRLSAKTPLLSASVTRAANKIYKAVRAGRAEITITPQAWLAARISGLSPETTQLLAALANKHLLPAPQSTNTEAPGLTHSIPQRTVGFTSAA